jgi:para-nitrobenzyl esterase
VPHPLGGCTPLGLVPGAAPAELRTAMLSDGLFRRGTRRIAEARTAVAGATFTYEFGWRSDAFDGSLSACHTTELPFVFDTVDLPALHGPAALLGTTAPPADLALIVHGAWIRVAVTGGPGRSDTGQFTLERLG